MKQHQQSFLASHGDAEHSREIAKLNVPYLNVRNASNPSAPTDVLDHYLDLKGSGTYIRTALAKNPNLEKRHVDALVDDPNKEVGFLMTKHPKLERHHMDKMLKDEEPNEIWKSGLAQRHDLPPEIFDHILKTGSITTRATLLGSLGESKPLSDREVDVAMEAGLSGHLADNKLITSHQIHKIMKSGGSFNGIGRWIGHPNLNRDHIKDLIHSSSRDDRYSVATSKHLDTEDVERFTRDPDERIRAVVTANPKITHEQLERLKNDPSELVRKNAEIGRRKW